MNSFSNNKFFRWLKALLLLLLLSIVGDTQTLRAQAWPENYDGVMLQGFYWDSFSASQWSKLEGQVDDLASSFSLVWVPQSGNCGGTSMGYDDLWWFNNYDSSFGTEQSLRSMIRTFRDKGLLTIADVVINHRRNVSNWVDFPKETYKGETYEMLSTDICRNDDDGATLNWATQNGYQLSANNDTGEGWGGMRDIDHTSANVQRIVKAYLDFLLNDLGYAGFRYDMVKGYSPSYTAMYNQSAQPRFSVGECWDSNSVIKKWIDGTKVDGVPQSAAFDFQFRYKLRDAINQNDWSQLNNVTNQTLAGTDDYRQWAVTFVENHDTERRANAEQDPIRRDTLAANAFMLAMPGTPCVFLKHWLAYKPEIKAMIDARRLAGITNTSTYTNMRSNKDYFANLVKVNNEGRLMVIVGKNTQGYEPSTAQWKEILSGYHYKYFLPRSMETAWANRSTGVYDEPFQVRLTAVSESDDASLVYTLDGSEPTAGSQLARDGQLLSIDGDCTLKVGLLVGGAVKGIVSRDYTFTKMEKRQITVHVNTDQVGWTTMNYWTWGGDDTHAPKNGAWPGDRITQTKSVNGKNWFYKTYTLNSVDDFVNFVFSTGTGSPQTVDVENVREDKFFEVLNQQSGNKYQVADVTVETGIEQPERDLQPARQAAVYTLDGRQVRRGTSLDGLPRGVYVVNGRKVVR